MAADGSQARDPRAILAGLGLSAAQADAVLRGEARLVVLAMSAHMDWDWLLPFPLLIAGDPDAVAGSGVPWYFGAGTGPATEILGRAAELLESDPGYRYSICEMGFLRGFAQADPAAFATFAARAGRIHLAGAGITSPDNLLPHGEAFIRNYLVGRAWAREALPEALISQCYLPDDFGHDPELPVSLQAMGMAGVGFARLPGEWHNNMDKAPPAGTLLQADVLYRDRRIDFAWRASDGSRALAHWMVTWYGGAQPQDVSSVDALSSYLRQPVQDPQKPNSILWCSPTQYVYVPAANDFQLPLDELARTCRAWNANPPLRNPTVYCAAGTFDDFVSLVAATGAVTPLGGPGDQPFFGTPYWCGVHATRPALKVSHHAAVRALLAAEAFGALAGGSGARVLFDPAAVQARPVGEALLEGWSLVVPSTHHDFITGTAHPSVYRSEQLPLMAAALASAEWLRTDAMNAVAAQIASPPSAPNASIAVFNQLGFARRALVECDPLAIGGASAVTCNGQTQPVMRSADGTAIFLADLPAMGYAVARPASSGEQPSEDGGVTVRFDEEASSAGWPSYYQFENDRLVVRVTDAKGWGIEFLYDKAGGRQVLPDGATANTLLIYGDGGTEYVLGCERGAAFNDARATQVTESVELLEHTSTRSRLRVRTRCTMTGVPPVVYEREYAVVKNEPFVRMTLTGRAPVLDADTGSIVLVRFPLASSIELLARGTPTHWTSQMPTLVWEGLTTYASHQFAVPYSSGQPLAGLLHADLPAWGLMWSRSGTSWRNDGAVYGAVLRNLTGSYYGWTYDPPPFPGGTDADIHTRRYAILVPSACGQPKDGAPQRAGLDFATPPTVAPLSQYLAAPGDGRLGEIGSLASATLPALVTAAKIGTRLPDALVLRVQQPTNQPLKAVRVTFAPAAVPGWRNGATIVARLVTALEEPVLAPPPTVSGSTITLDMPHALATLALSVAS